MYLTVCFEQSFDVAVDHSFVSYMLIELTNGVFNLAGSRFANQLAFSMASEGEARSLSKQCQLP